MCSIFKTHKNALSPEVNRGEGILYIQDWEMVCSSTTVRVKPILETVS